MPRYPCSASAISSRFIKSSKIGIASLIGIAKPIPSISSEANLAELIPITSPEAFTKAPPLLPGLIAASV